MSDDLPPASPANTTAEYRIPSDRKAQLMITKTRTALTYSVLMRPDGPRVDRTCMASGRLDHATGNTDA